MMLLCDELRENRQTGKKTRGRRRCGGNLPLLWRDMFGTMHCGETLDVFDSLAIYLVDVVVVAFLSPALRCDGSGGWYLAVAAASRSSHRRCAPAVSRNWPWQDRSPGIESAAWRYLRAAIGLSMLRAAH